MTNDNLVSTLKALAEMIHKGPMNMYRWVVENGIQCDPAPLPANIPLGEIKQCYFNCHRLMRRRKTVRERLVYCEGFALGAIIPVLHAWLITTDGKVVDPTWDEERLPWHERAYYGVPFATEYVIIGGVKP